MRKISRPFFPAGAFSVPIAACLSILFFHGAAPAQLFHRVKAPVHSTKVPVSSIRVVSHFNHDTRAFTQGLVYHDGYLYESTGLYGESGLFKKEISTGKIIKAIRLDPNYFGEGIAILGNRIYQLTYKSATGFVYDLESFEEIRRFSYEGQGWGLTTDGKFLYMSNGTNVISVHEPDTFLPERQIRVFDEERPVHQLNEMQWVKGEIWANIFTEDLIVRIDPSSGNVIGWVDLTRLRSYLKTHARVDVLNGIAYDEEKDRIFVTGKLWPRIFEIRLTRRLH